SIQRGGQLVGRARGVGAPGRRVARNRRLGDGPDEPARAVRRAPGLRGAAVGSWLVYRHRVNAGIAGSAGSRRPAGTEQSFIVGSTCRAEFAAGDPSALRNGGCAPGYIAGVAV